MKNWKTTILGWIAGLSIAIDPLLAAYNSGFFTEKSGWQLAASVAIIVIGSVIKDPKINKLTASNDGKVTPDKAP